jgi:hypothetical protein
MRALAESLLECGFFIPHFKFKIEVEYLVELLLVDRVSRFILGWIVPLGLVWPVPD